MATKEKRKYTRVRPRGIVAHVRGPSAAFACQVENLSAGGLFLRTEHQFPQGTSLQIDLVIDDRPENCLDVVLESQAGAILVWRGHRESVPGSAKRMGIAVVHGVSEALDAIVKIEQPEDRKSVV